MNIPTELKDQLVILTDDEINMIIKSIESRKVVRYAPLVQRTQRRSTSSTSETLMSLRRQVEELRSRIEGRTS